MDTKKEAKKYLNKYFKAQYLKETDDEYKSLVRLLNKALRIHNVVEQLPTDIEIGEMVSDLAKIADGETEKDFDSIECPNCGSDAIGYDGTGSVTFLECFQCDHNWIP